MTIKFNLYNIVDQDTKHKARVMYWKAYDFDKSGVIRISAKDYGQQLTSLIGIDGVSYRNDSDIMTDYFCKDCVDVSPNSPVYGKVKAACERMEQKNKKRFGYS